MAEKQPKMEIDQDLLQAITQQLKVQIQKEMATTSNPAASTTTPSTIKIGNYTLNPFPKNSPQSFRTKEPLTLEQQTLIDYSWNARNRQQLTVALHSLSYYFHSKNTSHKQLQISPQPESLRPEPPPSQLLSFIRELELENTTMKFRIKELEGVEEKNKKLKEEILRREKEEEEEWGAWKRFPHKITEQKREILELVLADYRNEQVFYQEVFRRLITKEELFKGITFMAETFEDDDTTTKGFSFIKCNIDLSIWKDVKIEGAELKISRLLQLGLIQRLYITSKKELIKIPEEKLMIILSGMMEEKETIIECEFHTIPASYGPEEINNTKAYITIRRVLEKSMKHVIINDDDLVPDAQCSLEDQIIHYRAMVYNKPYIISPYHELIGETADVKIFAGIQGSSLNGITQFSQLKTENAKEALYYHKIRAYYMTRRQGDLWRSTTELKDEDEDSTTKEASIKGNEVTDEIADANINNIMEY